MTPNKTAGETAQLSTQEKNEQDCQSIIHDLVENIIEDLREKNDEYVYNEYQNKHVFTRHSSEKIFVFEGTVDEDYVAWEIHVTILDKNGETVQTMFDCGDDLQEIHDGTFEKTLKNIVYTKLSEYMTQ